MALSNKPAVVAFYVCDDDLQYFVVSNVIRFCNHEPHREGTVRLKLSDGDNAIIWGNPEVVAMVFEGHTVPLEYKDVLLPPDWRVDQ